jgi:hypothetical protein
MPTVMPGRVFRAHLTVNFMSRPTPFDVQNFKGVVLKDAQLFVEGQEFVFSVFSRKGEGGLGQVVGAEGHEFGQFSDSACAHAGSDHFHHGAELKGDGKAEFLFDILFDFGYIAVNPLEFFRVHTWGIMISGLTAPPSRITSAAASRTARICMA